MIPRLPTTLALTLLLAAGVASQEPVADPAADPVKTQLEALLTGHDESELGYPEAYRAFRPRFEAFADANRGTDSEARATLWLVQQTWWLRRDDAMETTSMPLAEDLLERHPKSPHLGLLAEYRYVFKKEQQRTLFEKLLEVSPHREVKAAAHFGLAQMGPARLADGSPSQHFAALLDVYADVHWRETTFGQIADAHVNPLSNADLAISKMAPEIEGIDQDGEPMKLSDFRGKVVLLDFWGDW